VPPYDLAEAENPWGSAVLLHPHPDMGGDRFNNVVTALFDALPAAGVTVVRFDFSSSNVDTAVVDTVEMVEVLSPAPRFVIGYSFGGGIAARLSDDRIAGRCLIAPPPWRESHSHAAYVIAAEHDQFFTLEDLQPDGVVSGADHFFVGRTDEVVSLVLGWLGGLRP
jgi:alpha/beta superfamily hydrolase